MDNGLACELCLYSLPALKPSGDHLFPAVSRALQLTGMALRDGGVCRTDFQKIVGKIMALDYKIPEKLQLSDSVKDLLGRIFVKDPESRITIAEMKKHEWYLHRLPFELCEGYQGFER